MKKRLITSLFIGIPFFLISLLSVSGCSHTTPLKAPCNWSGNHCSPRIPINQWNTQDKGI